jgi:pimeloyl-ACP methyl ester carboxylesterase
MTVSFASPERQNTMTLADGRVLAWSEWGHDDALPVLFCTGAAMSGTLGFGTDVLRELGLKLIAIDRPGLGASDAHPDKTLLSWVDDARQFIESNHWQNVAAVGFSQGAPFALALAGHDLVQAIAIVSGQDQLDYPAFKPLLHPDVARMITAIQEDAAGFEKYFAEIATPEVLWQLIIGMSTEQDKALYLSDGFSQAYQRCLQEGFAQGAQGYARDLVNALSRWPVAPEDIMIPVDLWYGALDTSTVHSPDFGATLASRLPNASLVLDANAGGSILWTRSRDILSQLLSHLQS